MHKKDENNSKNIKFNYQIKKCDFCKGDIKNMEPIECQYCHGLFCLKHKFESDHNCPKIDLHKKINNNKIFLFLLFLLLILFLIKKYV